MGTTTKVRYKPPQKKSKKGLPLDTLAQLTHNSVESKDKFIKRQKAKAITIGQLYPLIDLDSPLKKSYWRTYHCNKAIRQEGHKMTTEYCNARWCTVCNRIRTGKMINAYSVPLMLLDDMHFVTLTTPNVKADELKAEIVGMYRSWRASNKHIRKYKETSIKGMRKLECTYNPKSRTYNPHYHLIVDSKTSGELIVSEWLKQYPKANRKGQDIRKADSNSLIELFKYTAKGVHNGKYHPEPLDQIYRALSGKRTYQPFGITKVTTEDIDGIQSQKVTFKGFRNELWEWSKDKKDWISPSGELLTGHILDGKLTDWIDSLEK